MIMLLVLLLLWFSLLTILVYGIVLSLTVLVEKFFFKNKTINFRRDKQYKKIVFSISFVLSIILSIGYLFINPAHNYKTAYIEKKSDKFIITIIWKKNLMVHDPISLLQKKTYVDSSKLEIPRADGIIDGSEIPNKPGYYKFIKGDAMAINGKTLKINLYFDNYDDKKIEASDLNGVYDLEWRK